MGTEHIKSYRFLINVFFTTTGNLEAVQIFEIGGIRLTLLEFVTLIMLYAQGHGRNSPPSPKERGPSQQQSIALFSTLRVVSCLHSTGLSRSCSNSVLFCCYLETCNLVTATTAKTVYRNRSQILLIFDMFRYVDGCN